MPDLLHTHHPDSVAGHSSPQRPPDHLNSTGCRIQYTEGKGRGVFASRGIPSQTLLEISPVLLFSASEYEAHGKYTALDQYTFKWRDGRMALALGLGSLFNHSDSPNVSYVLDPETESIRYTTAHPVKPDEELCIYYGSSLWFDPVDAAREGRISASSSEADDGWGGLSVVQVQDNGGEAIVDEDPLEVLSEEDLPFSRIKIASDYDDEDTADTVRTVQAWAVDIPDPRHTTVMLKWLKESGFDTPTLSHLKRIRKSATHSTLLLTTTPLAPPIPSDPDLPLSEPYKLPVPTSAALTPTSLKLKNALWPTVFAPPRKGEPEQWSRARLRWAQRAMQHVVAEARRVGASGELPIASYVPVPFEAEDGDAGPPRSFMAHDTRTSASHPLRHSVLNVIRQLADSRSRASLAPSPLPPTPSAPPSPPPETLRNGQSYLLTSLTLFTTHEPCLMCSMALLHSRVKEIFYLVPMPRTGGCGGAACVPKLEGVNHRFAIARWREDVEGISADGLHVAEDIDA